MAATLVKKSIYYLKQDNKLFCKSGGAVPLKIEINFTKIKFQEDFAFPSTFQAVKGQQVSQNNGISSTAV